MAEPLAWPHLVRPAVPILYLDLNHFINLAKVRRQSGGAPAGYAELWDALCSAVYSGRAVVPLSAQHVWEMYGISDPQQRLDVAEVMEELARFQYLLGRTEIGQLEIEAGIRHILGEPDPPVPLPLLRATIGQSMGIVGGVKIIDESGQDASERGLLAGSSDEDAEILRSEHGYAPEVARASGASRLAFEQDLSAKLRADERWRRGRLRGVVTAREFAHEWLDILNRINRERVNSGQEDFDVIDSELLGLIAAMPHSQVAISLKTRYQHNPIHRWSTNDIVDIERCLSPSPTATPSSPTKRSAIRR